MPLWPTQNLSPLTYAHTATNVAHWFERTGLAPISTSGAWTAANRIVYTPIVLPQNGVPYPRIYSGATVSGMYRLGVYADAGGRPGARVLYSYASLQAYTSRWESPGGTWPSAELQRGLVWAAAIFDSTSATVMRLAALTANGIGAVASVYYEDMTTLDLPAVATPIAASIVLNVPLMALTVY